MYIKQLMKLNSRNVEVWPKFPFLNVISALEGTLSDLFSLLSSY